MKNPYKNTKKSYELLPYMRTDSNQENPKTNELGGRRLIYITDKKKNIYNRTNKVMEYDSKEKMIRAYDRLKPNLEKGEKMQDGEIYVANSTIPDKMALSYKEVFIEKPLKKNKEIYKKIYLPQKLIVKGKEPKYYITESKEIYLGTIPK